MKKIRTKLTLLGLTLVLSTAAFAAVGTSPANAMTPAQSTSQGSVNTLIPDINNFWTANMRAWGWLGYYYAPQPYFYNSWIYACGQSLSPSAS